MTTGAHKPSLLARWLEAASADEPAPRAEPSRAPSVTSSPTSAEELLGDLEQELAAALPPARAVLVSSLLAPVRAAMAPGAKVDPKALRAVFSQVEDVLEAFLLASAPKTPGRG
jgi:hypothetical protein